MKNWMTPKKAGCCGCLVGAVAVIVAIAIALLVFIVVWGNNQDWPVEPTDSTTVYPSNNNANRSNN